RGRPDRRPRDARRPDRGERRLPPDPQPRPRRPHVRRPRWRRAAGRAAGGGRIAAEAAVTRPQRFRRGRTLGRFARPYTRRAIVAAFTLLVATGASVAGPLAAKEVIDRGIRTGSGSTSGSSSAPQRASSSRGSRTTSRP